MEISDSLLLQSPGLNWLNACQQLEQQGQAYVIATVIAYAGSVPRASGAKMVITQSGQFDTIGGGNLEYQVIATARAALAQRDSQIRIKRYALSADLGQCCGGAVQVMFEYFNTQTPVVAVFGAGHVAQALSSILTSLPCHLKVLDNRPEWLESFRQQQVEALLYTDPLQALNSLPNDCYLIVMTQDHSLDYKLVKQALEMDCFTYIGLIGSQGKKKRFEFRLREELTSPESISSLTCPIGDPNIVGKLPMQVAVSIAAQLIPLFAGHQSPRSIQPQSQWQQANTARKTISGQESVNSVKKDKENLHE